MRERIGVYICHCGSNISDYVDVEAVREAVSGEEGVALAKTTMFACADSAQSEMVSDIKENQLDGLVVASCSPKLHLYTFRNVAERAGLNPFNYVQANIREQVSWAHSDRPEQATRKAIRVVKSAISRARLSKPLTPPTISSENVVLVVGAGVAGMRTAIELADMGSHVYLIEKDHFAGGRVAQWGGVYGTDERGYEITARLYDEVKARDRINLFTGTGIEFVSGSVGNFEVTLKKHPRNFSQEGVDTDTPEFREKLSRAMEACPEEVPDPFDFGLTGRRAIYPNHPGQYPAIPAIDGQACTRCGKCEEILPGVDLNQEEESITVSVGAIVLCTGFDPYQPSHGEFGYGEIDNVITLQEFRRLISLSEGGKLTYNNRRINNISYIYCVGSRQIEGENKYCSRYCCSSAIYTAIMAGEKFKDIKNFHFHRGIRSYGKQESLYQESSASGDIYFQCSDDEIPSVGQDGGETVVKINDILTSGREIEVESDLVVLVTGMEPGSNGTLVDLLKVPLGRDGFFNEVHPKLKPVEIVMDGIFIAGTCHSPKNITETMNSALSAAVKSNSLISAGEIELEPAMARIDPALCEWCGKCSEACPFDAIIREEAEDKVIASVSEANCKGCGMCLPVCPVNAIQLTGNSDAEIESMIDALIQQE